MYSYRGPHQVPHRGPVEALRAAVKTTSRNSVRDATLILVTYRHGLRVSEAIDLRWDDVRLDQAELYVRRLKGSKSTLQPIEGDELAHAPKPAPRAPDWRLPLRDRARRAPEPRCRRYMMRRAGEAAGLPMRVHPHMLRHGCGYHLANAGANMRQIQDYLGHRNIQHTVRYTEVDAARFRGLWRRSRAA